MTRPRYFHATATTGHYCDRRETGTQGPDGVVFHALTRRHTGAASVSGLPPASSSCAWCARKLRPASAPVGHQRKRPWDRRLVASQNPGRHRPGSGCRPRTAVAKDEQAAGNGSEFNFSRHSCAKEATPLRPSTGSTASRIPHMRRDLDHKNQLPHRPAEAGEISCLGFKLDPNPAAPPLQFDRALGLATCRRCEQLHERWRCGALRNSVRRPS